MDDEGDDEDGFFVPHGYLSDGEGELDDGETAGLPKVILLSSFVTLTIRCFDTGKQRGENEDERKGLGG